MTHWTDPWKKLRPLPCKEAWDWAITQPDWQTAWNNCLRGDWMVFRLARGLIQGSPEHRKLMRVVCQCGRLSLPYAGKRRRKLARIYSALEKWAEGEKVDLMALRAEAVAFTFTVGAAAGAAYAAALAASYAALAASGDASSLAAAAVCSVANAAFAAYAADLAISEADADIARDSFLAEMVNIVRAAYPIAPPAR